MDDEFRVKELLGDLLALPYPSYFLLLGPPGSGKTTLATSALPSNVPLHSLPLSILHSPTSGAAHAALTALFARVASATPAVLLLDNIDDLAPSGAHTPALASLSSALDALALDPSARGLVILATASHAHNIHASLLRRDRFAPRNTLALRAPSWAARRAALAFAFTSAGDDRLLDDVASRTPGFLPADLTTLVSVARSSALREGRDLAPALLSATGAVRPAALRAGGGAAWRPLAWRPASVERLRGVDGAVETVRGILRGVFARGAPTKLGPVKGVLICGPTGCGKSVLSQGVLSFLDRGQANGFVLEAAEIIGAVVGDTERRLKGLFGLARAAAPAVLVVENVEMLAPKRGGSGDGGGGSRSGTAAFERILSTLLVELDGVGGIDKAGSDEDGSAPPVLLVATTGEKSRVDPALLRPGRLEVHVEMKYPSRNARIDLLRTFIRRSAPELLRDEEDNVDGWIKTLADATAGWSAVQIEGACSEAILSAMREHLKSIGETSNLHDDCGTLAVGEKSTVDLKRSHFDGIKTQLA